MSKHFFTLFAAVLWSVALFAEDDEDFSKLHLKPSSSLASTEGLVSSIIDGSVSAITGEYIDCETDFVAPGPEPFAFQRFYSSRDDDNRFLNELYQGWKLGITSLLSFKGRLETSKGSKSKSKYVASVTVPSGATVAYKKNIHRGHESDWKDYHFNLTKGFTNCGSGKISAATNLKNHRLQLNYKGERAVLSTGDGTLRKYDSRWDDLLKMYEESKLNHTLKTLEYQDHLLKAISITNPSKSLIYQWIGLIDNDSSNDRCVTVFPSCTGSVAYHFKPYKGSKAQKKKADYYLAKVENTRRPLIEYRHTPSSISENRLMISETLCGNKLCKKVRYYKKGSNHTGKLRPEVKRSDDERIDRVLVLKAPVGHDDKPLATHRFEYEFLDKGAGKTRVFDAYYHLNTYRYDKNHRLRAQEKYTGQLGESQIYSMEEYGWGAEDTPLEGNLMWVKHIDREKICTVRLFKYDDKGNIIRDRQYGTVTRLDQPNIKFSSSTVTSAADCYTKTYRYSQDDWNLLLQENEDSGKAVYYAYHPDSNAISAKLVVDGAGKVHHREFNTYDANLFLIQTISDDGISNHKDSLAGVTCRTITDYVQRTAAPFGYPAQVIEKYLDIPAGCERQLSRVEYEYNPDGQITAEHHYDSNDCHAFSRHHTYDAHQNLLEESCAGKVIRRSYDECNNKIFEQGPSDDFYTNYTYDFANRLIKEEQCHKDGQVFATAYRYDLVGNLIAKNDTFGNETLYAYDEFKRLVKVEHPPINTPAGPVAPIEQYTYNSLGQRTSTTDPLGRITTTQCNIHGKPLLITHPDQTTETFEYFSDGSLFKSYDKAGACTQYTRDCFGRVHKQELIAPDGESLGKKEYLYEGKCLIGQIDEEGVHTSYRYDSAGRLIEEHTGERKTTYGYDHRGRKDTVTKWLKDQAQVTLLIYDIYDRLIEEHSQDLHGEVFAKKTYAYDALDNKILIQDGNAMTRTEYNSLGQPVKITDAAGAQICISYDYRHLNELGQRVLKTTTTDPLGIQTIEIKDTLGRVRTLTQVNPYGLLLASQEFFYDAAGNLIQQRQDAVIEGKIERTVQQHYEYNDANQLVKLIEAQGTPEQKTTRYTYNAYGQQDTLTKPSGLTIHSAYDAKGRLKTIHSTDISYHYTYNKRDQVVKVEDLIHGGETVRHYDALGRLSQEKLQNGLSLTYAHDPLDRPIRIQIPDGSAIEYHYDAYHLRSVTRSNHTHHYDAFDQNGNLLQSTLPDGTTFACSYDSLNQLKTLSHPHFSQTLAYDAIGNLSRQTTIDPLGNYSEDYTYDDLNQLTSEEGHTYSYDSLHNRILKDSAPCSFNPLNQLLSQEQTQLAYDANGNLSYKIEDGIETRFAYDALDRLISVTKNQEVTTYRYDPFNRRLSKNDLLFFYEGDNEIGSWQNGLQELRALGLGKGAEIGAAVLYELHGKTYFPLHNHTGSVALLLDETGQTETYRYSAFGQELTGNALTPWRFSSKRHDAETNLAYFGRRYYDPTLGRWITTDPEGYEEGPNLYAYVENNPLTCFDLYGLYIEPTITFDFGFDERNSVQPAFRSIWEKRQDSYYDFSCTFTYNGSRGEQANMRIGFVNGIMTSRGDAMDHSKYLSQLAGGHTVHGMYNATHGFFTDLKECLLNLFGYRATTPVQKIHEEWDNFFKNSAPDACYLHNCHSQGAIHTRNALLSYPKELRDRILVVAIAPAAYIHPDTCKQVWHYCTKNPLRDPIPRFDIFGRRRAQGTIRYLPSHKDADWHDHSFQSPTYMGVIKMHCDTYRMSGGKKI